MAAATRTVLIVEDQAFVSTLLCQHLANQGFRTLTADSAGSALTMVEQHDPDVLLTDIDLGRRPNGVELAAISREVSPGIAVVFLTNYPSIRATDYTVAPPPGHAFVSKQRVGSPDVITEALESVLNDARPPVISNAARDGNPVNQLTGTQQSIVRMIAQGLTNQEIAERRGCSLRAVERLVTRAFEAMQLGDHSGLNPRVMATRHYIHAFGMPEDV